MSQTPQTRMLPSSEFASQVADIAAFDPGVAGYRLTNLGEVMRFGDIMAAAGQMLPKHLRGQGPLCVAVTMRAMHWQMDPFALAQETYVAQEGGVIGYQAKVFSAVARKAGITLKYEFTGKVTILDQPFKSANGRQISARTATGNRACRVWAEIDGEVLDYETPTLDEITIKNSPLWHNDPDQQLGYYAARSWMRRHRADLMMGAFSNDEVAEMEPIRDVTPKERSSGGFVSLARQEQERRQNGAVEHEEAAPATEDTAEAEKGADAAPEEPDEAIEIIVGSPAYEMGFAAAVEGFIGRDQGPFKPETAAEELANWQAGFDAYQADND